jgi:predicted Zn-dependent peptidase
MRDRRAGAIQGYGMNAEITKLSNGMRVVTQHMPHVETASLGVWVHTGARHEARETSGISHFLEHMAFKGTEQRSARAIAEDIEQVGGDLNAATSLETTAYYARVLKADVPLALEIVSDILQNPKYAEEDLEREREVILQEIAGTRDSPDDIAYDLLNDVAYPDQALGRPILGSEDTVKSFSASDVRTFLRRQYKPSHMVLSAAGHVNHDQIVAQAETLFAGLGQGAAPAPAKAVYGGGPSSSEKPFEQAHLLMGFESVSYRTPEFYTQQVFSGLFGGGMSSRLFQEVREKHGLCYSIYSTSWSLDDTGMLAIHAATSKEMLGKLIDLVRAEFAEVAATAPTVREVERSKAQLKAGLLMSLESSGARAEQMARQIMLFDRLVSPEDLVKRVDAVTPESVRAFAERLLSGKPPSIAIVGAGRKAAAFARQALGDRHAA